MCSNNHVVSIWGNAISIAEHRPETYSKNLTLTYPVTVPFDGTSLRVTFDNFCGTDTVEIAEAFLSLADTGRCKQCETLRQVLFSGNTSCRIPAGERMKSDFVPFPVKKGQTLLLSFYLKDFTEMRSAVLITGPLSKGWYSVGNHCTSAELPLNDTRNTNWVYFFSDLELTASPETHTVICYGDSITAQSWPDYLSLLYQQRDENDTAIVRKAASGTRVLREYTCITYESYGLKGKNRFPHELPVTGADTLIIQQGINDIIHPVGTDVNPFRPMEDLPTASELIEGLKYYIYEAKKQGLRVYLGTLLPIYGWRTYAPFREELRKQINDWIRTTSEADGYIDFAKALENPEQPEAFLLEYDSGDHLHPSEKAYERMAKEAFRVLEMH